MVNREWSRRDILKSVGVGALGLGVGAAVYRQMDEYIVGTVSGDGAVAAASVSESGHGEIDLRAHTSMTLVCGVFSRARSRALRARNDVAFVQPDRKLTPVSGTTSGQDTVSTPPWGIDRVDADVAHERGATGTGADVAVVDTGIDPTHADLAGSIADPTVDTNHQARATGSGGDCPHPGGGDGGPHPSARASHWVVHAHPHRGAGAIAADADPLPPGARE